MAAADADVTLSCVRAVWPLLGLVLERVGVVAMAVSPASRGAAAPGVQLRVPLKPARVTA